MTRRKRILIIFHEDDREKHDEYMVMRYVDFWRADGLEVDIVFGTGSIPPADVALLHVDRSVVPQTYLDFAGNYPTVLNRHVRDIRKSTFSRLRVSAGSDYDGPVIVKTERNFGGVPEWRSRPWPRRALDWLPRTLGHRSGAPFDYRLYAQASEVPPALYADPDLIVERFLPEAEGAFYFIRTYLFFGDAFSCHRLKSREPIIKSDNTLAFDLIDPHPDVVAMTRRLRFDFGKFDYVVHDGEAIVFDVNKTPGSGFTGDPVVQGLRRRRADAIYGYLDA